MRTLLPGAPQEAAPHASNKELARLLESLHAIHSQQVSPGLEERVLARLEARSKADPSGPARRAIYRATLSGAWAPALAAAALICVFAGGFLVAHQRVLATRTQPAAARSSYTAAPSRPGLTTASARRKPGAPVPAGHKHGRTGASTATGATSPPPS